MCNLRDLLATWEKWSARETLTRALARVDDEQAREALRHGMATTPEVDPLDALRDAAELVALLSGWQWQVMHSARLAGASWDEIGSRIGLSGNAARARFVEALDRQDRHGVTDTSTYRQAA